MKLFSRVSATTAFAAVVLVVLALPAAAHIDPDPRAAQVGTTATIAFNVEHGCGDSPTTALAFKLPAGVTNVKGVDKAGWTVKVTATEVDFTGGSQDAHTPADFSFTMTLPTTAGMIYFPVAQTCATGSQAWLDITEEGKPEPQFPAAALKVTAGVPTAEDLAAPADDGMDMGSTSHTGRNVAIGVIAAVVVLGGAGAFVWTRRRKSTPPAA